MNIMVQLWVTLALIAWYRFVFSVTEGPAGNNMIEYVSPFKEFISCIVKKNFTIYLGSYCTLSLKPIQLWTNMPALETIKLEKPPKAFFKADDSLASASSSEFGITGNKDNLQKSAGYPKAFGAAVAKTLQKIMTCKEEYLKDITKIKVRKPYLKKKS